MRLVLVALLGLVEFFGQAIELLLSQLVDHLRLSLRGGEFLLAPHSALSQSAALAHSRPLHVLRAINMASPCNWLLESGPVVVTSFLLLEVGVHLLIDLLPDCPIHRVPLLRPHAPIPLLRHLSLTHAT